MDSTPNLQLPYLIAAQAQKHVTHNEALRALDAVVQVCVLDKDLATPPGSPSDGDAYIVAASPTGAWAGQAGRIAAWQDGAWAFYTPREGWRAWVADEDALYFHNGAAWDASLAKLGINATPDTTNRLAVASPASLFNHAGGGHQVKINKATAGHTASQLFQDNFSGRAEYGLTGDDDFHLKVSPDGSTWIEALVVDKDDGTADFKKALRAQDHLIGTQATGPRIVAVGDSLTVGSGASNPYTALITYPTWKGQAFTVSNIGVAGRTMLDIGRLAYSNLNPLFACESGLNIAIVWAGTNDIALGASPENTYSYLAAACRRLRALGWHVLVMTMISRSGQDTGKNTYNGYIRTGWASFADYIVDLGADANIGADGAYANSTYFQADGVHLKDAGLTIVAGLVQTALTTMAQGRSNWLPAFGNAGLGVVGQPIARLTIADADIPIKPPESNTLLHVVRSANGNTFVLEAINGVPQYSGRRTRGTAQSPSAAQTGDFLATFSGYGYGSTGYRTNPAAFIAVRAAENFTDSVGGGYLEFYTTQIGTNSGFVAKGRLSDKGWLAIGQSFDPVCAVDADGPIRPKSYTVATLPAASAGAGQIVYVSNESGGAVLAFSDGTNWRRVTDRAMVS